MSVDFSQACIQPFVGEAGGKKTRAFEWPSIDLTTNNNIIRQDDFLEVNAITHHRVQSYSLPSWSSDDWITSTERLGHHHRRMSSSSQLSATSINSTTNSITRPPITMAQPLNMYTSTNTPTDSPPSASPVVSDGPNVSRLRLTTAASTTASSASSSAQSTPQRRDSDHAVVPVVATLAGGGRRRVSSAASVSSSEAGDESLHAMLQATDKHQVTCILRLERKVKRVQGYLCMREIQAKLLNSLPQYKGRSEQSSRSSVRQELEKLRYVPKEATKEEIALLKQKKVIKHNAPGTSLYTVAQVSRFLFYHDLDAGSEIVKSFQEWCTNHGYALSEEPEELGEIKIKKKPVKQPKAKSKPRSTPKKRVAKSATVVDDATDSEDGDLDNFEDGEPEEHVSTGHEGDDEEMHSEPQPSSIQSSRRRPREDQTQMQEDEDYVSETIPASAAVDIQPPMHDSAHSSTSMYAGTRRPRTHSNRFSRTQWQHSCQDHPMDSSEDLSLVTQPSTTSPQARFGGNGMVSSGWEQQPPRSNGYHQRMSSSGSSSYLFSPLNSGMPPPHLSHQRESSLDVVGMSSSAPSAAMQIRAWNESHYHSHAPAPLNPVKMVLSPMSNGLGSLPLGSGRDLLSPPSPAMNQHHMCISPFQGITSPTGEAHGSIWAQSSQPHHHPTHSGSSTPPWNSSMYKRARIASSLGSNGILGGSLGASLFPLPPPHDQPHVKSEHMDVDSNMNVQMELISPQHHFQTITTTTTTTLSPPPPYPLTSHPSSAASHLTTHNLVHARKSSVLDHPLMPTALNRSVSAPMNQEEKVLSESLASSILLGMGVPHQLQKV